MIMWCVGCVCFLVFFFNDTATTEIYTLSLHDALPISVSSSAACGCPQWASACWIARSEEHTSELQSHSDLVCRLLLEKKNRRQAARSNFDLVRMYADDVRKAYEPFMQRNKEMVKSLSIDLSPAGLFFFSRSVDHVDLHSFPTRRSSD